MKISNIKSQISNKLENGQSLFELVVAIGISALVIVVLVSLVSNALQNAAFSKNETLAGRYAQEATEWLRGQRDTDVTLFVTNVSTPFNVARCFNNLNWSSIGGCTPDDVITGTPFTRQIIFLSKDIVISGSTKTIIESDVTVSWTDSKGIHIINNATDFADWRQR